MKCPKCNGDKIIITKDTYIQGGIYDCDICHGTGEIEVSNEVWFCSLPTEEKAEVIAEKIRRAQLQYIPTYGTFTNSDWWEEWLKQPHRDKE